MNTAIVLAAGKGTRMNAGINKQFIKLLDKPMLAYTLEVFQESPYIDNIILVAAEDDMEICRREILGKYQLDKVSKITAGGAERQDSVYKALEGVETADTDIVLIHDGARPLLDASIIEKSILGAERHGAATIGVPIKETIKLVDSEGFIEHTPLREKVWVTQTPQAFKVGIIKAAHDAARESDFVGTDDAMLVERLKIRVKMIEGSYENIKVTTPEDKITAETILLTRQNKIESVK